MAETFQEMLKRSLRDCDPKLDRRELLVDIFKTYVAKMMEQNVMSSSHENRLDADFITGLRGYMIREFMSAELGEWGMKEAQYSNLFDVAIQEIFNDASHRHEGENKAEHVQDLEVNKKLYDKARATGKTPGGLYLP